MTRPIRRIVAGSDDNGKAVVLSDGPSPDVWLDPARPGFASTRLWVTDSSPAKVSGIRETLDSRHTLEPPASGTVFRVVEFPPEKSYIGKVTAGEIHAYFEAMGSPGAWTGGVDARHPYMQRTATVDFCYILEGEITLILDTEEVHLKESDTVVQRGTNHAWSNRSDKPCIIVFSHHDASMDR